jgi:hypothetical protein
MTYRKGDQNNYIIGRKSLEKMLAIGIEQAENAVAGLLMAGSYKIER